MVIEHPAHTGYTQLHSIPQSPFYPASVSLYADQFYENLVFFFRTSYSSYPYHVSPYTPSGGGGGEYERLRDLHHIDCMPVPEFIDPIVAEN